MFVFQLHKKKRRPVTCLGELFSFKGKEGTTGEEREVRGSCGASRGGRASSVASWHRWLSEDDRERKERGGKDNYSLLD